MRAEFPTAVLPGPANELALFFAGWDCHMVTVSDKILLEVGEILIPSGNKALAKEA